MRCSARAGVFATTDGGIILDHIAQNTARHVPLDAVKGICELAGRGAAHVVVAERIRREFRAAGKDDVHDAEFAAMERIRDMIYAPSPAVCAKKQPARGRRSADSTVSEYTEAGSVFSQAWRRGW